MIIERGVINAKIRGDHFVNIVFVVRSKFNISLSLFFLLMIVKWNLNKYFQIII